jgi:hypothetical protein
VADRRGGRLLGAQILAPEAGEQRKRSKITWHAIALFGAGYRPLLPRETPEG